MRATQLHKVIWWWRSRIEYEVGYLVAVRCMEKEDIGHASMPNTANLYSPNLDILYGSARCPSSSLTSVVASVRFNSTSSSLETAMNLYDSGRVISIVGP